MDETILAESYCPVSRRHAILSTDENSAWLYLHAPTDDPQQLQQVETSGFAFNLISPISVADVSRYRPAPPPIAKRYASDDAVCIDPAGFDWRITWSNDGASVLIHRNAQTWCFVTPDNARGYSKAIAVEGPWGLPWSDVAFGSIDWAEPA